MNALQVAAQKQVSHHQFFKKSY